VVICIRTAPLNVIRLRRSLYGTSMPGAGAVHHINSHRVRPLAGAMILWGAHNPLIRRNFLGVFRFAQMALAEART